MKSNFLKRIGVSVAVLTGIGLAASMITVRAQADQWDKTTLLTLDQPTQVGDTYLDPGTYMFKLANSDRHIVQIFTSDRSRLINTIIAIPSYRVFPTSATQVSFWETPPGTARAVRDWFYPGDYYGQEFRYPSQLRQIAAVTAPAAAPPPALESAVTEQPAAELQPPTAADAEQAPAEQPPVEIAQNNAPQEAAPQVDQAPVEIAQNAPQNNAVPDNSAPATTSQSDNSQTLPQTASPYPLIGLGGLLALGFYGVLRTKLIA